MKERRKSALPTGKHAPIVARKITLIPNAMEKRLDKRLDRARSTTQRGKSMLWGHIKRHPLKKKFSL